MSALKREAEYFWARHNIDRETPAPNTNTLIGYRFKRNSPEIPSEFKDLGEGFMILSLRLTEALFWSRKSG